MRQKLVTAALLAILLLSTLSVFGNVAAQSWTDISSAPYVIQSPGNYRVTATLGNTLLINASNVVLDGQNHQVQNTITIGDNVAINDVLIENIKTTSAAYGIIVSNVAGLQAINVYTDKYGFDIDSGTCSNIYMRNYTFNGLGLTGWFHIAGTDYLIEDSLFTNGDYLGQAFGTNGTFRNCVFSRATEGVDAWGDVTFEDCLFTAVSIGITADGANLDVHGCTFSYANQELFVTSSYGALTFDAQDTADIYDNVFSNNYHAFCFFGDNYDISIHGNTFRDNDYTIYSENNYNRPDLSTVYFYNNYIADSNYYVWYTYNGASQFFDGTQLFLNITPTAGTRVNGDTGQIGGNYWSNPSGTGYSDTHSVTAGGFAPAFDLFGDGEIVDHYPLGKVSTPGQSGYTPGNNDSPTTTPLPFGETPTPTPTQSSGITETISDTGEHFINDTKNLGGELLKGNIGAIVQYPFPFIVIVLIWVALGLGVYAVTRKKRKGKKRH